VYANDTKRYEVSNTLERLYEQLSGEVYTAPADTTLTRATQLLNKIRKEPTHAKLHQIQGETMLLLMKMYDQQKEYDSVRYYYDKIEAATNSNEFLGDAELYISKKKMHEKKYYAAIRCLYKALDHFKKENLTEKQISTYLQLARLFKKINNIDLAREMDAILMKMYVQQPISQFYKSQILINHASYLASLGKNTKAVHILQGLRIDDFSKDPQVLRYYYQELTKRYARLEKIAEAKAAMDKMYGILQAQLPEDTAIKNIYLALLSVKEKKYKDALYYAEAAKNNPAFSYVEQFELIKLHKACYMANQALGNYKEAFVELDAYHNTRNSIKNFNLNLNASILNFKLNHDEKLKDLEEKNEMNALVMEEKKKFYIFSTFFVSASVLILIFLRILHQRNKNQLKLQYENEKMKEVAEIKNNFIENLSHEIRTPITITTGYLRMITNNAMDYSKIVKYTDLTIRNNEQIIGMLNNFLTLLKLDKESITPKKTVAKLGTFLRESIVSFQGVAEIKGVYVYYKSNIKPQQKIEYAYEDLRKIINNLVSNALKYTSPTYGIYVDTFIDKKGLTIIVKDERIGIDKREQKRIFDRFYQTKNNLSNGGFGIGLSLVQELVTNLNGTIELQSKKNVGSIFTIQLPLAIDNPQLYIKEKESDYQNISRPYTEVDDQPTNLPKILIVDDNIEMIGYLRDLLKSTLDCTFAFDGAQALAFAEKKQYDLILSDLRMPIMDGHHLKSVLNTMENYQATPFIIITASAEEYVEHSKCELGIQDYLIKPFEGMELLARIHYHLENTMYKKQLQNTENETIEYNGAYAEFMEKVNAIILENLTNNEFTINELANQCGYCHKQFIQIIQEKSGLTPVKLILEIRLRKAYDLIVNANYDNISEVLYAVGLNSRSYFNKVFVKRYGLKPGELIKKCKVEKKAS
jgi:signal transduction histidine kinase/DNA-binding response OmpR family regulator